MDCCALVGASVPAVVSYWQEVSPVYPTSMGAPLQSTITRLR